MYKLKTLTPKQIKSLSPKLQEAISAFKEDSENFSEDLFPEFEENDKRFYALALKERENKVKEVQDKRKSFKKTNEEKKAKSEKEKKEAAAKQARKLTSDKVETCKGVIAEIKTVLNKYSGSKPASKGPVRKKKVTDILVEGFSGSIRKVIRREITTEKVKQIKVEKLEEATTDITKAFKKLRLAFGGIANDNDKFISQFEGEMKELIKEVKSKQNSK